MLLWQDVLDIYGYCKIIIENYYNFRQTIIIARQGVRIANS